MKLNKMEENVVYKNNDTYYKKTKGHLLESSDRQEWALVEQGVNTILDMDFTEYNEKKRFRAEYQKRYWYLTAYGEIVEDYEINSKGDNYRYQIGNYFETKKETEEYKQEILVKADVKKWVDEHNGEIDWKDNTQEKWYFKFCEINKRYSYGYMYIENFNIPYFTSKELADECFAIYGERWKKYVWKVEK